MWEIFLFPDFIQCLCLPSSVPMSFNLFFIFNYVLLSFFSFTRPSTLSHVFLFFCPSFPVSYFSFLCHFYFLFFCCSITEGKCPSLFLSLLPTSSESMYFRLCFLHSFPFFSCPFRCLFSIFLVVLSFPLFFLVYFLLPCSFVLGLSLCPTSITLFLDYILCCLPFSLVFLKKPIYKIKLSLSTLYLGEIRTG